MLSVVVIAKNEEELIKGCLESIKWADEIILVDSKSSDKTVEIARKYTDKIFTVDDERFDVRRSRGIQEAKGDWVLYIDPDERVLWPLREEIKGLIKDHRYSAFALSRRNIIFGKEQKYSAFWPDWMIRLLKKEDFMTWVGEVHEYATFKGKLGYSKNSLLHLTHRNLDQIVLKSLAWSNIDARLRLKANHPQMTSWRFIRILITETLHQGVIRGGFFHGTISTIDSILQTFSLMMTYIRLWQLQQTKLLNEVYKDIDKKLIESDFKY